MIIGRVTLLDIILWEELSSFPLSSSSVSLLLRGGGIKIQHRELKTGKHNLRLHVKCQLKVLIIHPDMSLFVNNILALVKGSFQKKNDETYGKFHMLGGAGGLGGSFSICYHERFLLHFKPF